MKKLILFLFLFLSFPISIQADAGNNVRYGPSGGSSVRNSDNGNSKGSFRDWFRSRNKEEREERKESEEKRSYRNEGSTYRENSDRSTGKRTSLFDLLFVLISSGIKLGSIFGGLWLLYFFLNKASKKIDNDDTPVTDSQPTEYKSPEQKSSETKPVNKGNVKDKIKKVDPLFDEKAFLSYAEEVYVKLQNAWTRKDWKEVRQYESESLYQTHSEQLQEYIQKQITNVVERIGIKDSSLYEFKNDSHSEYLVVRMNVVLRDYVIDDATRKVLEGEPTQDLELTYELVFVRKKGQKTRENHAMHALECPSCGSRNGINEKGICDYCGYQRSNDWVLNSIKTV